MTSKAPKLTKSQKLFLDETPMAWTKFTGKAQEKLVKRLQADAEEIEQKVVKG